MTHEDEQISDASRKDSLSTIKLGKCVHCGRDFAERTERCPFDGGVLVRPAPSSFPFKDKYQFVSELGRGGMSIVFKAYQPDVDKLVAIKVLQAFAADDNMNRRFQNEARVLFSFENPHVVRVLDYGLLEENQPYMVMDFVDGKSLAQELETRGTLPVEESLPIFLQICDALKDAHSKGVLHRDMKPGNIMLTAGKEQQPLVKIIDFGIAKLIRTDKKGIDRLTVTGDVLGSPAYMSPEQALSDTMDERSDIYSFGCLMYETLTGCPPLIGTTPLDTLLKHINDEAPSLSAGSLKQSFPPDLEKIVAKCLKKSPADRYESIGEVADDLRSFVDQPAQSTASRPRIKVDAAKPKQKGRHVQIAALFSVLAVCGIAIFLVGSILSSVDDISKSQTRGENAKLSNEVKTYRKSWTTSSRNRPSTIRP